MNCVICKHGQTRPKAISVTLERGPLTLVFNVAWFPSIADEVRK